MKRRDFCRQSLLSALGIGAAVSTGTLAADLAQAGTPTKHQPANNSVHMMGEGLFLSPADKATAISALVAGDEFATDRYLIGGAVERLEIRMAELLGKEAAVFLPTGTLANHLAIRVLAGPRRVAIAEDDSHLVNDAGDCLQALSGIRLETVAGPADVAGIEAALKRLRQRRFAPEVGVISLESPSRRRFNAGLSREVLASIRDLARREGIAVHLDGARLPMQCAHQDWDLQRACKYCDTVYVSLYKLYNTTAGAIVAGDSGTVAEIRKLRGPFGAVMYQAWPVAGVALGFCDDYAADYRAGLACYEQVAERLVGSERLRIRPIENGTNANWLQVTGGDSERFVERLAERDVHILEPRPQWDGLLMMVNPTWARREPEDLVEAMMWAAG